MNSDHFRREEIHGLAEHSRFSLDASDSPADYAESIDHGGVGIGADKAVGIVEIAIDGIGMKDTACQILKIDLVDDADAGRNNSEGLKGLLAPFQELVALAVALELHVEIQLHRVGPAVVIDLNGVIDDEIDRNQRLDDTRLAPKSRHGATHGGQINEKGNSGEVLQNDTGDDKGDFLRCRCLGIP